MRVVVDAAPTTRDALLATPLLARTEQQTGIAVRVEAVARGDGVGVGALHHVETRQRRDQHEQGRARQVEIGHHHVDRAEGITRRDEQRGLAVERADAAVLAGRAFEEPQRGRAYGDDAAAGPVRRVERLCGLRADAAGLGMHAMRIGILDLDRQKSAGADVQCHRVPVSYTHLDVYKRQLRRQCEVEHVSTHAPSYMGGRARTVGNQDSRECGRYGRGG